MPANEKATAADQATMNEQLVAALTTIAESNKRLAEIETNKPTPKLTYDQYIARHPDPALPFQIFQNGFKVEPQSVPVEALALLPKLQVGRFNQRRVHVYRDGTPDRGWHIDYPNKSVEDRMLFTRYARDFVELLERLTTETPDLT